MSALGIVLISFTPGLFWLWFFVRLDRLRPSPRRWIALSFIFGMVSTIPAGIIETLVIQDGSFSPDATLASVSVAMLAVVGPVEETSKFLAVRLSVYRSLFFEEPMDGLVYGAAASLGFASLENLLYVLTFGPEIMIVRAPFSTLAHLVFGCLWGYGLGLRRMGHSSRAVWAGLAGSAVFHGVSNILLFTSIPWLALLLDAAGAVWAYRLFKWGQRVSPFRYRRNIPLTPCVSCGSPIRVRSPYCRLCGAAQTAAAPATLICGNCRSPNRGDATYCTDCGDRLLR